MKLYTFLVTYERGQKHPAQAWGKDRIEARTNLVKSLDRRERKHGERWVAIENLE